MKPVVGYKTTAVRKYDWQPELEGHMAGGKGLSTAFGSLKKHLRHRSIYVGNVSHGFLRLPKHKRSYVLWASLVFLG